MSAVGAFVHLYHVWGALGLLTALTYGPAAWRNWRLHGGRLREAPRELVGLFARHGRLMGRDLFYLGKGLLSGIFFSAIPGDPEPSRGYGKEHSLLLGVMLGGLARFLTAFYWSEKNTGWMDGTEVWIASVPVLCAVVADLLHQASANPDRLYRMRLLGLASILWITFGAWWWA